jgi:hypothetical protein
MKPADLRREFAGDRIVDAPSKSVRSARNFRIDQVDLDVRHSARSCSTADDIATQMRRNETRPLRFMSAFQVNSGTAASAMGNAQHR